jgi:hypothetical protein
MRRQRLQKIKIPRITVNHIMDKDDSQKFEELVSELNKSLGSFPLSVYEVGEKNLSILSHITKFVPLYLHISGNETVEGLYKNKSDFYIYFKKKNIHIIDIKIVFKPEQLNEVEFFINRLKSL